MDYMIINRRKYIEPDKRDIDWGIYILGAGRQTSEAGGLPEGRVLKDFAFVYVVNGEGKYFQENGKSIKVKSGGLIVLFPDVWHRYTPDDNTTWDEYWVIFNGSYIENLRDKKFLSEKNPVLAPGYDSVLEKSFGEILNLCFEKASGAQKEMSAGLLRIIARAERLERNKKASVRKDLVTEIKAAIEKSDLENPLWPELAKKFNMSYVHFRRLFKKDVGISLHQYYLQVRINKAKELLSSRKYSIKEICERLGFKDQYYFSRIFRKKTGSPPSTWQSL